jgi:hypothetical protein
LQMADAVTRSSDWSGEVGAGKCLSHGIGGCECRGERSLLWGYYHPDPEPSNNPDKKSRDSLLDSWQQPAGGFHCT